MFFKREFIYKKKLNFNTNIGVDSKLKGGGAEYYKENKYNEPPFLLSLSFIYEYSS